MNQKTAKLLKKYALHAGKTDKEMKRWWMTLPWTRREGERKRMIRETGGQANG